MDGQSGADGDRSSPHVVIIGAGVSGLLLAQGLKNNGVSFTIVDQEESAAHYRARKWGMSIQWALPMLSELLPDDLHSRLQAVSVDPHFAIPDEGNQMPVYNVETGEHMKSIPLTKYLRVSRRKFRALLAEGIDVQYNTEFRALRANDHLDSKKITALFSNGEFLTCNLLVAADGANSAVRESTFAGGKGQSQQIHYGGVNMHVCYKDRRTAKFLRGFPNPLVAIGMHPRGYWLWLSVQDVPDPNKPEDWVFQLQWSWQLGPGTEYLSEQNLERLKAEAGQVFAEPWKTAWTKIPDGTPVPANRISVWPPIPVEDPEFVGKVALVGDSAHAMSFHRGQGLNHGITDAVKLIEVLKEVRKGERELGAAVKEYEIEMIKRAGEEAAVSRMNTEMVHDWERLKESPFMQRGGDRNK